MQIKDYMSTSTVTISESSDYRSAFKIMSNNDIHHLPVVNNSEQVIGILALRDLTLAANYYRESPVEVTEIMHTPVLTAQQNDSIVEATNIMIDNKVGCLPVLDNDRKLTGMLTETDLFQALRDVLKDQ